MATIICLDMLKRKEKLAEEMLLNKRIRNPGLELIGLRTTGRRLMFFFSSSNLLSFPKVGRYWPERLFNQKRKLKAQIWALQTKVREAYENLRISSRFCADMFLKVRHLGSVKRSKEGDGRNKILLRLLIVEIGLRK